jgi:hypothetical protein
MARKTSVLRSAWNSWRSCVRGQRRVLTDFQNVFDDRTVYIVHGAAGWVLRELRAYDNEDEVLLEPVCHFQVNNQQHAPCRRV